MTASVPEGDASIRAFVGLGLGGEARRALAGAIRALATRRWAREVRWVDEASLHLTLRFLGDVAAAEVPRILEALEAALAEVAPFTFTLGDPVGFPTPRRPRVVAVGPRDETPTAGLAAVVERAIVALGLPPEPRPFRAHVTLGRLRRPPARRIDLSREGMAAPVVVPVTEVRLYQSVLDRAGSRYSVLGRVPLGASDAGRGR